MSLYNDYEAAIGPDADYISDKVDTLMKDLIGYCMERNIPLRDLHSWVDSCVSGEISENIIRNAMKKRKAEKAL